MSAPFRPRAATALVAPALVVLALGACIAPDGAVTTAPVDETTQVTPDEPERGAAVPDLAAAAALAQDLSEAWVGYVGAVVGGQGAVDVTAARLAALHDPELVTFDPAVLETCVTAGIAALSEPAGGALFEHSSWRDGGARLQVATAEAKLFRIDLIDNLVAGGYDGSVLGGVVVGPNGVVGHLPPVPDTQVPSGESGHVRLAGCLREAVTLTGPGSALVEAAVDGAEVVGTVGGDYDGRAFFSAAGAAMSEEEGESGTVARRPAFPADPDDPEPIESTGANKWDLITADDPTAFACVEYLGTGPEEFIPADKDGGYERVEDVYLYRARFIDGTSIDVRIHPEIGAKADADAELDRYLVPLGQLPTVLRRDIGRFAVRSGDNTATASEGEGMMLQTGNATVRIADGRLAETLFHEAVHTSLDPLYGYQRSQEWLDAQAADGRWLTEYGRQNPDGEDLAESALYAFAVIHHPDRLPAGMAATIAERIPHRLAFLENVFPPDQPLLAAPGTAVACGG